MFRTMKIWLTYPALGLMVASLSLTACGDDDSDSDDETTTTDATTTDGMTTTGDATTTTGDATTTTTTTDGQTDTTGEPGGSSGDSSAGETGLPEVCAPDPKDDPLTACVRSDCCAELDGCESNAGCSCLLDCVVVNSSCTPTGDPEADALRDDATCAACEAMDDPTSCALGYCTGMDTPCADQDADTLSLALALNTCQAVCAGG